MSVPLSPPLPDDIRRLCDRLGRHAELRHETSRTWRWSISGLTSGFAPSRDAAAADLRAALAAAVKAGRR
jgi:hypothetical protein